MRYVVLGVLIAASASVRAGPIADEFGPGYGGVGWNLHLADIVGMMPEGEHYFSDAPGQRDYAVSNDGPLLGVPRQGMRVRYYFDQDDGLMSIAIAIPYDRYQQMLGVLIAQFGRYARIDEVGAITYYRWKEDQKIRLKLRVTKEPRYGIAEVLIRHVTEASEKAAVE